MPRLIFYTPFPEFDTEGEYNEFIKEKFKSKTGIKSPLGLPLEYDVKGKNANWEGYKKHTDELNNFKKIHIQKFNEMIKNHHEKDSSVIDERYPIERINKKNERFSTYTPEDILFIHCHGNTAVIGTGGFVLTPELLAENLMKLNLSKENPPVIVIWACKSGTTNEEYEKSYAEKVREQLKKLNYKNLAVIGIDAKIMINSSSKKNPVTYIREEAVNQKKINVKSVKEKDVLVPFLSPETKNQYDKTKTTEQGMFTQLRKVQHAISSKDIQEQAVTPVSSKTKKRTQVSEEKQEAVEHPTKKRKRETSISRRFI